MIYSVKNEYGAFEHMDTYDFTETCSSTLWILSFKRNPNESAAPCYIYTGDSHTSVIAPAKVVASDVLRRCIVILHEQGIINDNEAGRALISLEAACLVK